MILTVAFVCITVYALLMTIHARGARVELEHALRKVRRALPTLEVADISTGLDCLLDQREELRRSLRYAESERRARNLRRPLSEGKPTLVLIPGSTIPEHEDTEP